MLERIRYYKFTSSRPLGTNNQAHQRLERNNYENDREKRKTSGFMERPRGGG